MIVYAQPVWKLANSTLRCARPSPRAANNLLDMHITTIIIDRLSLSPLIRDCVAAARRRSARRPPNSFIYSLDWNRMRADWCVLVVADFRWYLSLRFHYQPFRVLVAGVVVLLLRRRVLRIWCFAAIALFWSSIEYFVIGSTMHFKPSYYRMLKWLRRTSTRHTAVTLEYTANVAKVCVCVWIWEAIVLILFPLIWSLWASPLSGPPSTFLCQFDVTFLYCVARSSKKLR